MKPWEQYGISRATYFRRKRTGTLDVERGRRGQMQPPVVVAPMGDGRPVHLLYEALGEAAEPRTDPESGERQAIDATRVSKLASAFNATSSGLARIHAMVSYTAVREIVELVDAELSDATRQRLREILDRMDGATLSA